MSLRYQSEKTLPSDPATGPFASEVGLKPQPRIPVYLPEVDGKNADEVIDARWPFVEGMALEHYLYPSLSVSAEGYNLFEQQAQEKVLSALDAHLESMKDEKEIHAEPVIYGIGSDADDSVINAVISKAKEPGAQVLLLNNKTQYSDAVLETIKDAYGVRVHQSMASAVMAGKTLLESVRQAGEQSDETTQASMESLRAELAGLKAFLQQ